MLEAPRALLALAALPLEEPEKALLFLDPMLPVETWRLPTRSPPPPPVPRLRLDALPPLFLNWLPPADCLLPN